MRAILAIDPGAHGGMAVWTAGKVTCEKLGATEGDRLSTLRGWRDAMLVEGWELVMVLEQVGGFVGRGQPGSAMFKFGEGYGFLKGVIQTLEVRLVLVRPQVWQKRLGLGTASVCAKQSEWKRKLKEEAQRRYPKLAITGDTADAVLILDWALSVGAQNFAAP